MICNRVKFLLGGGMNKNKGFTLIELMVTIAVMAIIAMIAAPSFGNLVSEKKLNGAARELVVAINQAKSQAALMKTSVALCLNKTNSDDDFTKDECATALIPSYATLTANQKLEAQKTRVISVQINPNIVVDSTSATTVLFNDVGSANSSETFSFCKSGKQKTVFVTRLGIVSQTSGTC